MTTLVHLHETGDAARLVPETAPDPVPAAGEVLVRQTVIGVNYVDIYHRSGLYPLPALPVVLGVEAAGVVQAAASACADIRPGDRVAYAMPSVGAYAALRAVPAERLIRLPDAVSDRAAGGAMLRGVTAHMLLTRVFPVAAGTVVLVHAAAGGLGLILTQWARHLGAKVIGTVGSAAKAEQARAAGADQTILYGEQDFVQAVQDLTGGRGADVAYDGIGGQTLPRSFEAVRPFGTVVSIGQAGGPIAPIEISELGPRRSLSLSRPSVFAYMADVATYRRAAEAFVGMLAAGTLRVEPGASYPLAEAAAAHRALETRRTTGSVVLVP